MQTSFNFMAAPLATNTFGPGGPLTVVDLCCGCGMASLGFREAGFEILGGVDVWPEAVEAYNLNHGNDHDYWPDAGLAGVEEAVRQQGWAPDVVLTGPPCQDDSCANQGPDQGRGAIKAPALELARRLGATWIVMEMVSTQYLGWAIRQGARQIHKLQDCQLGGYTLRTRWFAVWGPADLDLVSQAREPRGWGEALGIDDPEARLATESNSKAKRWGRAKSPDQPADACVGGDRRHVIRLGSGEELRLGPQDEAALSGFPHLQLQRVEWISGPDFEARPWTQGARNERDANTMVGNGWTAAFGRALGRAIKEAHDATAA